ncbi:MAG TPA: hypothetical protein GX744_06830 [Firmicutes bacterium]|nr:hypothetical protein [Bacillota bacterium]
MKIGARTVKTGLAVTLTILLINILEAKVGDLGYNLAGMAAVTAIIAMQPTIKGSLKTFRNRLIATLIGTLVTLALAYTLGLNAFYLGIGSIVIVLICLALKLNESIRFALITLVALGIHHNGFDIMDVVYRVSGMLIGLTVSTGLNIVFMPPDYTDNLKTKINDLRLKFEHLYERVINDLLREEKIDKDIIKDKRQNIRDELDDTREVYSLLIEDVLLTRDSLPANKIIIKKYRRSINAIQSNLERLTALHRSIVFMPGEPQYSGLRRDLYRYLKYLLILHQNIYSSIALSKGYETIEKDVDREEIYNKITKLIKKDNHESIFEFYNAYFEATRINEKLEQLIEEFALGLR